MKPRPALRAAIPLVLAAAFAGCEQAPYYATGELPVPSLSTNAGRYKPGDRVTVRLANTTGIVLGYDPCKTSFERYVDNEWSLVQRPIADTCTPGLRTVGPGQRVAWSFALDRLPEGDYRMRTEVNGVQGPARANAFSNTFRIVRENND